MGPQDDFGLQEAIKTTLVQLCKVGVIYQCELAIAGTVGVTVDRKRTILVHFDERLDPCQPDTSTSIAGKDLHETFTTAVANNASTSLSLMASNMGLPCSPTQTHGLNGPYPDLANFSPVGSSTKNEAYSQTLQTSIPIPIDIDSDSESLCELRFEDDVIEVDPPSTMIRKKEVMWSGEDDLDPKMESKCNLDIKAVNQERVEHIAKLMAGFASPTSSAPALGSEEPVDTTTSPHMTVQNTATPPIKLLVDKRLFLKKASPEKVPVKAAVTARLRQTRSQTKRKKSARASAARVSTDSNRSCVELFPPGTTTVDIIKEHHPKGKLCCEVCGKNFQTQSMLEAHLVEAHGVVDSVEIGEIVHYTCRHCKKKFRYQATLDKHEFLHVAAKPHKCTICNNTYCYAESLQIHMNIHEGILDCLICQKMYSSRKHLQKHIVYMHEMRRVRNGATPKKVSISMTAPEQDENEEEESVDKAS